ncbi:uncharacterized protein LOC142355179, partial [Convolutriloba macropyga]|uniref:uncharacterized protein LOC142355179 n=1 Tax=Convolutriloba macropyga TaxID=536237 RepID=UPI003F51F79A
SESQVCLFDRENWACKITQFVIKFTQMLPDFLNCLLSIDRWVAVTFSLWYSRNCTRRNAWVAIFPLISTPILFAGFRSASSFATGTACIFEGNITQLLDLISTFLGVPAIVAILVLTLLLVHKLKKRGESGSRNDDNQTTSVTRALLINGVIYSIFAVVQYLLLVAFILMSGETQRDFQLTLGALGYLSGSVSVLIQGPIFMTMRTMRHAFTKSLGLTKGERTVVTGQ